MPAAKTPQISALSDVATPRGEPESGDGAEKPGNRPPTSVGRPAKHSRTTPAIAAQSPYHEADVRPSRRRGNPQIKIRNRAIAEKQIQKIQYAQYRKAEPRQGRALECTKRKVSAKTTETRARMLHEEHDKAW